MPETASMYDRHSFAVHVYYKGRTHKPQSDNDETKFASQCQIVQLLVCGRGKIAR